MPKLLSYCDELILSGLVRKKNVCMLHQAELAKPSFFFTVCFFYSQSAYITALRPVVKSKIFIQD